MIPKLAAMETKLTVLTVRLRAGRWVVTKLGEPRPLAASDDREAAYAKALDLASESAPCKVLLRDEHGVVEHTDHFGDRVWPPPTSGYTHMDPSFHSRNPEAPYGFTRR